MNKYFCTFVIRDHREDELSWVCDAADKAEAERLFWKFAKTHFTEYTTDLIAIESLHELTHRKPQ